MSGAGPSSSGGHSSASHVDGESLALMRRLQEEDDAAQLMAQEPGAHTADDAALAAQLAAQDRRSAGASSSLPPPSGLLPIARTVSSILAAPAHKHVAPLGRNTAKRIALEFKTDGSVLSLLTLLDSAQRPRVLELVDGGQRARVEAECHALRIDLLAHHVH